MQKIIQSTKALIVCSDALQSGQESSVRNNGYLIGSKKYTLYYKTKL